MAHSKVIEEFVGKQLRLLKQEARAEQIKLKQEGSKIQAEAVSSSYDDNLGWIIEFTCSFQETLKTNDWLATVENKKRMGLVYSIFDGGFYLSVTKRTMFPAGKQFTFSRSMQGNNLLQKAILDIQSESVYKSGETSRHVRDVLLGLAKPRTSTRTEIIQFHICGLSVISLL